MRISVGPKPPAIHRLKTPNYSARPPIVNDANFTDGPREPTLGSAMDSFNPGAKAAPLAGGAPRVISPPGKRIYGGKTLTNKRVTNNIL